MREQAGCGRSAEIGVDQQDVSVFGQQRAGHVDGDGGFAVSGLAAGDQQGFVADAAGTGQFQIGAKLAITFAHDRIGRLTNDVVQVHAFDIVIVIDMADGTHQRGS